MREHRIIPTPTRQYLDDGLEYPRGNMVKVEIEENKSFILINDFLHER